MAASHRELRMQPHTTPGFSKHFRAFSIASVSRESAHHSRKRGALRDKVSYWFTVLATLAPGVPVRIEFSYAPVAKALMETLGRNSGGRSGSHTTGQPSPIKDRHSTMQLELDADPNSLLAEVRIDSAVSVPEWLGRKRSPFMKLVKPVAYGISPAWLAGATIMAPATSSRLGSAMTG